MNKNEKEEKVIKIFRKNIFQIYFDIKLILLERPPGQPEPGPFLWKENFLYTLPFEFYLPIGLPTTYESLNGYIRYLAIAKVHLNVENKVIIFLFFKLYTHLFSIAILLIVFI